MTRSVFRNAFDRMIAARQEKARGLIRSYLLTQDDATLNSMGFNREDVKKNGRTSFEL
ncbi:hypothetical protein [Nitratireductor sp. XY-223]|uniref:hypothetical protein n=1 Tax=Nitratireductor sp. XY-223 TaxID=2561926 RepID=UPI00145A5746|nr:hypothetical protein [Nitratireductor sp. XY-223]